MANAFTGGIMPGGLTTDTEIKILLCYVLKACKTKITLSQFQDALVSTQLVNFFEIPSAISSLVNGGHIIEDENGFSLTASGENLADLLQTDLPKTVREKALDAMINCLKISYNQAENCVNITSCENGYLVKCSIKEQNDTPFSLEIYLPDLETAQIVKEKFVQNGADVYSLMLAGLTGNQDLAKDFLAKH